MKMNTILKLSKLTAQLSLCNTKLSCVLHDPCTVLLPLEALDSPFVAQSVASLHISKVLNIVIVVIIIT